MRIGRAIKWPRAVRRLRDRFVPEGLILLYHRVTDSDSDPWSLCVTRRHVAEHLEVLQRYADPMTLQHLAHGRYPRKRARRAVAVTFDDGYADNLHSAKPLLERYGIPATIFVTSGYVESEREFWWDELERLLLQPGTLPESATVRINGNSFRWELGESARYSEDEYRRHRGWRVNHAAPTPRHSLYYSLWKLLGPLAEDKRRSVLDQLLAWSGAEPGGRSTHPSLSVAELLSLNQGHLIEIGSHTVTHPFLSTLPAALQRDEIQRSKSWLEKMLSSPVTSFAYPHGDYGTGTIAMVREAEYTCACSTFVGSVRRCSDRFQLPRMVVQDWDGEEFARRLSEWFRC